MTEQVSQTSVDNKPKPVQLSKKHTVKDILAFLNQKFPKCFSLDNDKVKPVKLGIIEDIVVALGDEVGSDKSFSKTTIRHGIKAYVNSWAYITSCKPGAKRVDLDGVEGDVLTEEHLAYAQERLEILKKKAKELHLNKRPVVKGKSVGKKLALPALVPADINTLNVEDTVYVQMNNHRVRANVTKIEKDHIYARFRTGLVTKVKFADVYQPEK